MVRSTPHPALRLADGEGSRCRARSRPTARGTSPSFGPPQELVVLEHQDACAEQREAVIGGTSCRVRPGQPTHFRIVGVVADEPFRGVGRPADRATRCAWRQWRSRTCSRTAWSSARARSACAWRSARASRIDPAGALRCERVRTATAIFLVRGLWAQAGHHGDAEKRSVAQRIWRSNFLNGAPRGTLPRPKLLARSEGDGLSCASRSIQCSVGRA